MSTTPAFASVSEALEVACAGLRFVAAADPTELPAVVQALVLHPDGTTTAWNKNKTKVLHSHSPPARPG